MPLNLTATLKKALRELEAEKAKIGRQITAIHAILQASSAPSKAQPARKTVAAAPPARRRMSPKARKAAGARMKAYWAKKKEEAGKSK